MHRFQCCDAIAAGSRVSDVAVGPDQRYTLAMMNSLDGQGAFHEGVQTITHVAQLLFAGRF